MQEEIEEKVSSLKRKNEETEEGNIETGIAVYEVGQEVKRIKHTCREEGIHVPEHMVSLANFVDYNNKDNEEEE